MLLKQPQCIVVNKDHAGNEKGPAREKEPDPENTIIVTGFKKSERDAR